MGRGDLTGKLSKQKNKGPVISFDEGARKTFLTGFRKRKNDRRQFARQKIAEQVRQEKLSARQEKRVMQREALTNAGASDDEDDEEDAEPAGAEVATYDFGDALATVVVEPLLQDEPEEPEEEEEERPGGRGASYTAPKKPKKFNLSQPLSQAIPGYKPKVRASACPAPLRICTALHGSAVNAYAPRCKPTLSTRCTICRCWRAVAAAPRRLRRRRSTRSCPSHRRPGDVTQAGVTDCESIDVSTNGVV